MSPEERGAFLRQVRAFAGVSEEGLKKLAEICRPVEKKAGEVVIKEGEEGDCVFIIESGQVEISMSITLAKRSFEDDPGAMDKVLVKLGPGALFGEMAFIFDHEQRSATIVALTEVKLLSISSRDFRTFADQHTQSALKITLNIARIIAERLRKTNLDMKKLTTALSIALRKPRRGVS